MALNPRAMSRVFPGFARAPGSSKEHTRQCVTKPCERKQRRRDFHFLSKMDFGISPWPPAPELHRGLHWPDDAGGGMVGEIRKEVHKEPKKERAIPPPPVKEDPILPLRSRAGKDGTDAIYI